MTINFEYLLDWVLILNIYIYMCMYIYVWPWSDEIPKTQEDYKQIISYLIYKLLMSKDIKNPPKGATIANVFFFSFLFLILHLVYIYIF